MESVQSFVYEEGQGQFAVDFDEFDNFHNQNEIGLESAEPEAVTASCPNTVTLASLNTSFDAGNEKLFNLDFEGGTLDSIDVTRDSTKLKSEPFRSPSPMSMTASLSGSEPYSPNSPHHSDMDDTDQDLLEYLLQDSGIQVEEDGDEEGSGVMKEVLRTRRRAITRSSARCSTTTSTTRGVSNQGGPWCKTKNRKNSKNAIAARENRQKKKQYLRGLEEINSRLSEENSQLKKESDLVKKKIGSLEEEVGYLRKVLFNQSALAGLLKKMNQSDVRLTSNFKAKEIQEGEASTSSSTGGVCLHVNGEDTSLKFCARCARKDQP